MQRRHSIVLAICALLCASWLQGAAAAVTKVTSQLYTGLSGDSKPGAGTQIGAEFYETDTKAWFVYVGDAGWAAGKGGTALGISTSATCSNADVDALETLCTITLNKQYHTCKLSLSTTVAFTEFTAALDSDSAFANTATDFTLPKGHVHSTSGDLTTMASAGWIQVDGLEAADLLTFNAASTNANVTGTYDCAWR